MIEFLNSVDMQLFLFLNGLHNSFFDFIMYWLSDKDIWIPFYLFLVFLIIRKYRLKGLYLVLFTILAVTLADQGASHLIKALVQRLRPSHEPLLEGLVHIGKAGAGGLYGFVSSHTANTFGLAFFLYYTLDPSFKPLKIFLFFWAFFVSYSRIYNGVHYPGDVLGGFLLGWLISWLLAKLFVHLGRRYEKFNLQKSDARME